MTPATRLLTPILSALVLTACQAPSATTRSTASTAATMSCRAEVDRVYAAQNRVDLSTRDQRDSPFAASYLPGVTTQGLGARYGRDNMMGDCLDNVGNGHSSTLSGAPATTGSDPGPTFSPVAR